MYLDREFHKLLVHDSSFRVIPKMKIVINDLNSQIKRTKDKHSVYNGYHTAGFSMLLNTIYRGVTVITGDNNNDQISFLKDNATSISDYSILMDYLEPIRSNISRSFASSGAGGFTHSKYFISSRLCKEYIFSVEPRSAKEEYPLDKGKEDWRRYRAFRMVDVESNDFTLNISSGLLNFTRHTPKFCIFTFDPVAAILQFINLSDEISYRQYVHQYLILPALTLDYIRLWMLGNYSQWFASRNRDYNDIPMVTSSYAQIPINLNAAMSDVASLIDNSNHMGVSKLLSSLPLPTHTDIPRYASVLYARNSLDVISEYDWGSFMIYRRLLDVAIRAISSTISCSDSKNSIYTLRRAVSLLSKSNLTAGINDSYTKHFVKLSIANLVKQTEDLYDIARLT